MNFSNPMIAAALGAVIRALLQFGAGWLVGHGVWKSEEASTYVAAATFGITAAVLSLARSLWLKYKDRLLIHTALAMPAGSTVQDVKARIKSGDAPPAGVPENRAPELPSERDAGWPPIPNPLPRPPAPPRPPADENPGR